MSCHAVVGLSIVSFIASMSGLAYAQEPIQFVEFKCTDEWRRAEFALEALPGAGTRVVAGAEAPFRVSIPADDSTWA